MGNDDRTLRHNYHNNDNVSHVVDEQYDKYGNTALYHAFLQTLIQVVGMVDDVV
eukprot:CAMPEP_0182428582 /NCGR_PEP_ID=MMETSP1167-20130531/23127_1 /TAXON_ID=2988 /ORGANISM="Mallomonas Sp, Strain CCMP3275" /LENGTH=53 /DNA_ID=CAMNT_0024611555 /DNA_START=565 /DNA_END=726 /DNA_ORIENTATION=-